MSRWQVFKFGGSSLGTSGRLPLVVRRVAEAMMAADPVMALSGRSLMIRVNTYEYLLAASEIIAEAG